MEATQTTGYSRELDNTHKNNYIKLFPTLYAMYSIVDKTSISFNYSRRINRPSYESLNPFRTINNSNSYNEGNAFYNQLLRTMLNLLSPTKTWTAGCISQV